MSELIELTCRTCCNQTAHCTQRIWDTVAVHCLKCIEMSENAVDMGDAHVTGPGGKLRGRWTEAHFPSTEFKQGLYDFTRSWHTVVQGSAGCTVCSCRLPGERCRKHSYRHPVNIHSSRGTYSKNGIPNLPYRLMQHSEGVFLCTVHLWLVETFVCNVQRDCSMSYMSMCKLLSKGVVGHEQL